MTVLLLILGSLLMVAAIALAFKPWFPAALAAYAGLWVYSFSDAVYVEWEALLFWGIATLIVLGLDHLLPKTVTRNLRIRGYITGGALAGMVVGLLFASMAGVIICSVVGAFFGALAFTRTPSGKALAFPSTGFLNYLAALGLPAVVTFSMMGLVVSQVIMVYGTGVL